MPLSSPFFFFFLPNSWAEDAQAFSALFFLKKKMCTPPPPFFVFALHFTPIAPFRTRHLSALLGGFMSILKDKKVTPLLRAKANTSKVRVGGKG